VTRSLRSLFAVRVLLIANGVCLVAIGALYLGYGARPAGFVVGGLLVAVAAVLFGCVPLTDPYRRERRRSNQR
jgi:hypothetical protein